MINEPYLFTGNLSLILWEQVSFVGCKIVSFSRQVEQKPGGRGRDWATLGVHPLSWLISNNQLETVPLVSVPHTSSNRLLRSNQDKGCTPSVAHSLALPLGPALLNLWSVCMDKSCVSHFWDSIQNICHHHKFIRIQQIYIGHIFCMILLLEAWYHLAGHAGWGTLMSRVVWGEWR